MFFFFIFFKVKGGAVGEIRFFRGGERETFLLLIIGALRSVMLITPPSSISTPTPLPHATLVFSRTYSILLRHFIIPRREVRVRATLFLSLSVMGVYLA